MCQGAASRGRSSRARVRLIQVLLCRNFGGSFADERSNDEPLGYCSVTTTGISSICQGGMVSIRGISDWNVRHLCYLEHFVCGRDHLVEAVDCIPCGSSSASGHVGLGVGKKERTEFQLDVADEEERLVWVEPVDVGGHDVIEE